MASSLRGERRAEALAGQRGHELGAVQPQGVEGASVGECASCHGPPATGPVRNQPGHDLITVAPDDRLLGRHRG